MASTQGVASARGQVALWKSVNGEPTGEGTGGMAGVVGRGLLETERILLWLIGILGAVTRDDLTKLLKPAGISCSTCDRAIGRLEGRPSRRKRGGLGPWNLTKQGLQCPDCRNRNGEVTAIQLGSDRRGGVAITYGHGNVDAGPNALKGCRKTFTGEGARRARLALKRYLLQPLPDQLVEQHHYPLAARYLLQLNDAGRECLAADFGSPGRPTPGPFPLCDGGDRWQATGRLLYAEFMAELVRVLGYARKPWALPTDAKISVPGPTFEWTAGQEKYGMIAENAAEPRRLPVLAEMVIRGTRFWIETVPSPRSDASFQGGDHRDLDAWLWLWGRFHRHPAPGHSSVYKSHRPNGIPSRVLVIAHESQVSELEAIANAVPRPSGTWDDYACLVRSPVGAAAYVADRILRKGK